MVISTHFVAGAAIAEYTDSQVWLIVLTLASHAVMDRFPHWEYIKAINEIKGKYRFIALDVISGPLMVGTAWIIFAGLETKSLIWLFWGGLLSALPDAFTFIHYLFPRSSLFQKLVAWHKWNHIRKKVSFRHGFLAQLIIVMLSLAALYLKSV